MMNEKGSLTFFSKRSLSLPVFHGRCLDRKIMSIFVVNAGPLIMKQENVTMKAFRVADGDLCS